jgi:hypothetical protein
VALLLLCGSLAAHWSGAPQAGQRRWLGALAGGLATTILFCSLGAGAAGALGLGFSLYRLILYKSDIIEVAESVLQSIVFTYQIFWGLLLSGMLLGALGSLWPAPRPLARWLKPWPRDPMMALNASIAAMPSAAIVVILAAAVFAPLPALLQTKLAGSVRFSLQAALDWPLATSLLLYLASQLALGLATQHEARQSTHICGLDEVKMAAYVGIFLPMVLAIILGLLDWHLLARSWVWVSLLTSQSMAAWQVVVLFRSFCCAAQMPPPADPLLATLFGVIADLAPGRAGAVMPGLVVLLATPIYITVVPPALNVAFVPVLAGLPMVTLAGWTAATRLNWFNAYTQRRRKPAWA